jgi:hypothetical protein
METAPTKPKVAMSNPAIAKSTGPIGSLATGRTLRSRTSAKAARPTT